MKKIIALSFLFAIVLSSCISNDFIDDFVEPTIRITTTPDTILINSTFQFEYIYLNNIGINEEVDARWTSENPSIIQINPVTGLATTSSTGSTTISVNYTNGDVSVHAMVDVNIGSSTVETNVSKNGNIQTTSSYTLEGNFELREDEGKHILEFFDDYKASSSLPGLYVYLSNNRNTIANAFEIGPVDVFSGAHSYSIEGINIDEYSFLVYFCKPFNVKVGDGIIQ